jgi:TRAP-type C4-dicarboxylate transport system permease large subunit
VNLFTRFLSLSDVVSVLSEYVVSFGAAPWVIAVALSVLYLILGTILEPLGAMLLTLPVLLPVMEASGASMIWYGVLIVKLLETGMISPPVGMNVFVVKNVVGDRVTTSAIFRGIWWFMAVDVVVVGLAIAYPPLITTFPDLLGQP